MCKYSHGFHLCRHGWFVWTGSLEFCGIKRLNAYEVESDIEDMCENAVAECKGSSKLLCDECSETNFLEGELDE